MAKTCFCGKAATRIVQTLPAYTGDPGTLFRFCHKHLPSEAIDVNGRIAEWVKPDHLQHSPMRLLTAAERKALLVAETLEAL